MKKCDLCGADVENGTVECTRCGFVFHLEISSDMRDVAILNKHAGKSVEKVHRDIRNARAKFTAYLDNMAAKSLSPEEVASLVDEALSYMQIPLSMGVEDELRFDHGETEFISLVVENLDRIDQENGNPVGTSGTYIRLANALQAMGEPEKSMRMIESALLLNPRDREAMFTKAKLLFQSKKYPQARKCLEKLSATEISEDARYLLELIDQISME
jgi:tetratricopeptide (TPR) repeat protein